MKERPILFFAPMVRAIVGGRKTQTRRIVKPQPEYETTSHGVRWYRWHGTGMTDTGGIQKCLPANSPYGQPGDRLWVRETLRCRKNGEWEYGADHQLIQMDQGDERVPQMIAWAHHKEGGTCVSIHMPRWASRITLEVTGVRVERVQEIRETDARCEGVEGQATHGHFREGRRDPYIGYCGPFQTLWDSINAKRAPWASNPWVWVIEFKRLP